MPVKLLIYKNVKKIRQKYIIHKYTYTLNHFTLESDVVWKRIKQTKIGLKTLQTKSDVAGEESMEHQTWTNLLKANFHSDFFCSKNCKASIKYKKNKLKKESDKEKQELNYSTTILKALKLKQNNKTRIKYKKEDVDEWMKSWEVACIRIYACQHNSELCSWCGLTFLLFSFAHTDDFHIFRNETHKIWLRILKFNTTIIYFTCVLYVYFYGFGLFLLSFPF